MLGAAWLLRAADTPEARRALTAAAPCGLLSLCAALALGRAAGGLPQCLLLTALPAVLLLVLPRRALVALAERPRARTLAATAVAAAGVLGIAAFLPPAARGADVVILALLLLGPLPQTLPPWLSQPPWARPCGDARSTRVCGSPSAS